jgi:transketolase
MSKTELLRENAKEIRRETVNCIASLGVGHIGGCLSIADLLAVLYFDEMKIDPKNPKLETRDRLVVSKGHSGPAIYAVLAIKGYFDKSLLATLNKPSTNLPSHCDMNRTPGIDMTTGSLGQGLSAAVGIAYAAKMDKNPARAFAILGEGDTQEGQTWEAAMYAASQKLNNLIAFTDKNDLQIDNPVDLVNSLGDLEAKWKGFGWNTVFVKDGNDVEQILAALKKVKSEKDKPSMIILQTVKGKGVSFTEGRLDSHHTNVSEEQHKLALEELKT